MPHRAICPEGHRFTIDDPPPAADVLCPECGKACDVSAADNGTPRPRGLWALMGKPAAEPAAKGLWALMGSATKTAPAESKPQPPPVPSPEEFRAVELDELSSPAPAESPDSAIEDELEVAPLESLGDEEAAGSAAAPPTTVEPSAPQFVPQRSRGAVRSVVLGGVAVLAAGFAVLPEFYAKIPGTLVGFLALMVGLLAMGEIRRSRGRQRGRNWAGVGIALGVLGMLLGPFVFSPLGGELRLRYGRRQTAKHLEQIGEALNAYEREHGHFPPGGTYQQKKGGEDVPLHSWMTMLLPHLGESEAAAFKKIDLKLPWNHERNRSAMERNVSAFHAAGASRTKTQSGFAVTHFAALGGTLDVENVGRVNVGIFGRNSRVKRSDVTDGLEQTLVAGEIAANFPPWGEPGQYRAIGKGLNKSPDGFGNADRTGAMFLRADGSVKFLSNKVDPDALRRLSTRDGREKVDRNDY